MNTAIICEQIRQEAKGASLNQAMVIYAIILPNSSAYVGLTTRSFKQRFKQHLAKSKTAQNGFAAALSFYDPEDCETYILHVAKTKRELANKEREFIKRWNLKRYGLNSSSGGEIAGLPPKRLTRAQRRRKREWADKKYDRDYWNAMAENHSYDERAALANLNAKKEEREAFIARYGMNQHGWKLECAWASWPEVRETALELGRVNPDEAYNKHGTAFTRARRKLMRQKQKYLGFK